MKRRALVSVTDKSGVVELGRGLAELGFAVTSTGGTFTVLREAGIEVEQVAGYTGFPEILGGRVKTLHPRIHGGILARRGDAEASAAMAAHGIDPIDVVAVNLYRFREAAARAGAARQEVVESIDIGGPSMIRSAAKNHEHVCVVVDPGDYGELLAALRAGRGTVPEDLRRRLAAKAFAHTAAYDAAIAAWFAGALDAGPTAVLAGERVQELRYGENPHQRAAFYALAGGAGPSLARARQLSGKELSYNNLHDLDAALGLAGEFAPPACVVVKHGNPCGTAVADTTPLALAAAFAADPLSAFGSIVALNRPLDAATASALVRESSFVEAVVAPRVDDDALAALHEARWGRNVRVLSLDGWPAAVDAMRVQQVSGGFLLQTPDAPETAEPAMRAVTARAPDAAEEGVLAFAWKVCKHVKSNAIVLARAADGGALATAGVGAGQMSRVDAVEIAVNKAGARAAGCVLASDAFFPFADGIEAAAAAGVVAVIQPGGSRRDDEVIAAADRAGVAMVFSGMRHFRH